MQYDVAIIDAGHNGLMPAGHVAKHNIRRPPRSIYRLALRRYRDATLAFHLLKSPFRIGASVHVNESMAAAKKKLAKVMNS